MESFKSYLTLSREEMLSGLARRFHYDPITHDAMTTEALGDLVDSIVHREVLEMMDMLSEAELDALSLQMEHNETLDPGLIDLKISLGI